VTCVFVKQSLGPFLCGLHSHARPSFFRSYGGNLPSSLTRFHSSALEYSSRPPVSVYSTVNNGHTLEIISWHFYQLKLFSLTTKSSSLLGTSYGFTCKKYTYLAWTHNPLMRLSLTNASSHRIYCWYRNIDLFPIDYAFQPYLRGRLTLGSLALPRKPWACGVKVYDP